MISNKFVFLRQLPATSMLQKLVYGKTYPYYALTEKISPTKHQIFIFTKSES